MNRYIYNRYCIIGNDTYNIGTLLYIIYIIICIYTYTDTY